MLPPGLSALAAPDGDSLRLVIEGETVGAVPLTTSHEIDRRPEPIWVLDPAGPRRLDATFWHRSVSLAQRS
jgi:hypothetical protein